MSQDRLRLLKCVVILLLVLCATEAVAQDGRFDVQRFRPMPGQRNNFFTQASSEVLPHLSWEVGLLVNYADDSLVVRDDKESVLGRLVAGQLTANVVGAISLVERLEIGLDIPVVLYQTGEFVSSLPTADAEGGLGIGDIRLVPKAMLWEQATEDDPSGFGLAFLVDFYLPIGREDDYQSEGFRIHPRFAIDYDLAQGTRFGINLGYQVRPENTLANVTSDDNFTAGVASDIVITDQLSLVPELNFDLSVLADELGTEETALELLVGAKYWANDNILTELIMGTGVLPGYGSPDWRVVLAFSYSRADEPVILQDRDGDGCYDDVDPCPDDPEDLDGFEDDDCCPDPDNDQDGILDVDDECPNEPEDVDMFEDENGCPDPDNDQDGVLDINDGCPIEPEDIDMFEDDDGCPDPDNDQDRILDVDDMCPIEPEVYNGLDDEDGCPDETQVTIVQCVALELGDRVYFDTDSDVIQERSYPLLFDLTNALLANPSILRVQVAGHTDDRGSDEYNLDLSRRRAASVMRFLIAAGIEESRLESEGYGESVPVETNVTDAGRQANRRVEVIILEQEGCE